MRRVTLWRAPRELGTHEALRRWHGPHVDLVERVPNVRRYVQTDCVDAPDGAAAAYAGVGEVWFDDESTAREAITSKEWRAALEDARRFMDFDSIAAVWLSD